MKRIIVCDTGPLLHLSEAGVVHLLTEAGEICIPPKVVSEFEANAGGWKVPVWASVRDLDDRAIKRVLEWTSARSVDAGEAQAISLALQLGATWFLTDDARARQFAGSHGLEVHGTIGLLLWNVAMGFVEDRAQAMQLLEVIAQSSLWISDQVLEQAKKVIRELFE